MWVISVCIIISLHFCHLKMCSLQRKLQLTQEEFLLQVIEPSLCHLWLFLLCFSLTHKEKPNKQVHSAKALDFLNRPICLCIKVDQSVPHFCALPPHGCTAVKVRSSGDSSPGMVLFSEWTSAPQWLRSQRALDDCCCSFSCCSPDVSQVLVKVAHQMWYLASTPDLKTAALFQSPPDAIWWPVLALVFIHSDVHTCWGHLLDGCFRRVAIFSAVWTCNKTSTKGLIPCL